MATPPKKPGQQATTPGNRSVVDDIPMPNDDVRWGRYWPNVDPDPTWVAVTEEAPSDGQEYVRKNLK